mmetsp:Transcript_9394/g.13486  ORF Transcript_9394/g.13486 Transcript_9394/m.13486 type:complete len:86 (+) Transcript_9394:998-1255(+)
MPSGDGYKYYANQFFCPTHNLHIDPDFFANLSPSFNFIIYCVCKYFEQSELVEHKIKNQTAKITCWRSTYNQPQAFDVRMAMGIS